jgi:hypothetical protein
MILLGEIRREHVHRRQVDIASGDHLEHQREPPRRPRRRDPLAGRRLRHVQPLDAECEQGRARLPEVQPAPLDLDEISQELGCDLVRPPRQPLHALEHSIIGHFFKTSHRHAFHIPRTQHTSARAASAPLSPAISTFARVSAEHLANVGDTHAVCSCEPLSPRPANSSTAPRHLALSLSS